jgi:hypothetical protein
MDGRQRVSSLKRLLRMDWDALAGVIAAVAAIVMHFLHLVETDVLLVIAVVLLAIRFLRDLRLESADERMTEKVEQILHGVSVIRTGLVPPDIALIGSTRIRGEIDAFQRRVRGEVTLFHLCLLMYRRQPQFDALLRPLVENPQVTSIMFVLDNAQRDLWEKDIGPRLRTCQGSEKIKDPCWTSIDENVSLILADSGADGRPECLLSIWGEPFMARLPGRNVPRYVFLVHSDSELLPQFVELARKYRLSA